MEGPELEDSEDGSSRRQIYVVRIPKKEIELLQKSSKFLVILRLCRYRNQMIYCMKGFEDYGLDDSPEGHRQRFNSIWFLCAVLYEAIRVIPDLGKEFRHFPSFQKGFATFLKDPALTAIRAKLLKSMRNTLTFHVDHDAIEKSLATYDVDTYEFLAFWDQDSGNKSFYYPLADEIVFNAFIESDETHASKRWPFEELWADVLGFMTHFSHCADELIREYIMRKKWVAVEDSQFYEPKEESDLDEYLSYLSEKHGLATQTEGSNAAETSEPPPNDWEN